MQVFACLCPLKSYIVFIQGDEISGMKVKFALIEPLQLKNIELKFLSEMSLKATRTCRNTQSVLYFFSFEAVHYILQYIKIRLLYLLVSKSSQYEQTICCFLTLQLEKKIDLFSLKYCSFVTPHKKCVKKKKCQLFTGCYKLCEMTTYLCIIK